MVATAASGAGCLHRQQPQSHPQGIASITLTPAQLCCSSSKKSLLFISRAARDDSKSASQDMHGSRKRKPRCSLWQTFLGFCIISSLRLQGSEHKPVQSHCSRSPLAKRRAIMLLCSCCSQGRAAAPLQPSGSSNPFPQHIGTRFCLPQLGNLTTAKNWQRTCTAREVGLHLLNS